MKTVAQWAEQLPELIRIEFIESAKIRKAIKMKFENIHTALIKISWVSMGCDFWMGIDENIHNEPHSADYLDESVPYTKEEVEAMILEYADPNDEVCQQMLLNIGIGEKKELIITQSFVDEFNKVDVKKLGLAPSANAKPIVLDELGQEPYCGEFKVEAPKEKKSSIYSKVIKTLKAENEALKREVEFLKERVNTLQQSVSIKDETLKVRQNIIDTQAETIEIQKETIATLTQMRVAPKKEQSIFFDLLKHLNIIKK